MSALGNPSEPAIVPFDAFIPRGSSLTDDDVAAWVGRCGVLSAQFVAHEPRTSPSDTSFLASDFGLDPAAYMAANPPGAFATEMWQEHIDEIADLFFADPYNLMTHRIVRYAIYLSLVGEFAKSEFPYLKARYSASELEVYLTENHAFYPTIIDDAYQTTETRVHHLTHLTYTSDVLEIDIRNLAMAVEFGGGFGSMTDLIRRLNGVATQMVIDFPVMLMMQAFYLRGRYGADQINFIRAADDAVAEGKINLCPVNLVAELEVPTPDLLIATWSLSEANAYTQSLMIDELDLLSAANVLYGYRRYETQNPRQPCSAPIAAETRYDVVEDKPTFWTLDAENNYQLLRRR